MNDALHPALEPYVHGLLEVGDGHCLYFEQCGNPQGLPVVFLHGGPGSGCSPAHRRLIDPQRFRTILFDQRGCGRSQPRGELTANTTAHLLADIENLRRHLGIPQWLVFGGSWGASLALAYCAAHRTSCLGAILRGSFLTGEADLDWFLGDAAALHPDAWSRLAAHVPAGVRVRDWLFDAVADPDEALALRAVTAWMQWEDALTAAGGEPPAAPRLTPGSADAQRLLDKYRLQAAYLRQHCFLGEAALLDCARALAGLPTAIAHGRLDFICRPVNAWAVHRALPGSRLQLVADAGHSPFDAPMTRALRGALSCFAEHGSFVRWGGDPTGQASS